VVKVVGTVLVFLTLVVGISVGGWQLGWWLKEQSVNRNAKILYNSYPAQSANADAFVRKVNDYEIDKAKGQSEAILIALRDDACRLAHNLNTDTINHLSPKAARFYLQEC
jgi:hypothetical protein